MPSEFNNKIIELMPDLKRFARSLVTNRDDVLDLVQDTYLKAILYNGRYRADINLKAWLLTIMKNNFINNYRRKKNAPFEIIPELRSFAIKSHADSNPDSSLAEKELNTILGSLKQELKEPFLLHLEGYKYEEIAEKLNVNIGTIKSRIFICRKKMMDIINKGRKFNPFKDSGIINNDNNINQFKRINPMEAEIIRFRNTCQRLITDKGCTKNRIIHKSGISWPTLIKIIDSKEKVTVNGPTLEKIRKFNNDIHNNVFSLESNPNSHIPNTEEIDKYKLKEMPEQPPLPEHEQKPDEFWDLIKRAIACTPAGLTIKITFHGK